LSSASSPTAVKVSAGSGTWTASTVNAASGSSGSSGGSGSGGSGGSGSGGNGSGDYYSGSFGGTLNIKYVTYLGNTNTPNSSLISVKWPSSIAVGSSASWVTKRNDYAVQKIWSSDSSLVSVNSSTIKAKASGSVTIYLLYVGRAGSSVTSNTGIIDNTLRQYATGGLADFTGPAWLDGTSSKPELVLNPKDTENLLTAVQGMRGLDPSTLSMLNRYVSSASLAMQFGLSGLSAGSILSGSDTLQQEVHITAEFPNATDSAEIQSAFDNIINRATQYITTKR
jgi:hypothetical protein